MPAGKKTKKTTKRVQTRRMVRERVVQTPKTRTMVGPIEALKKFCVGYFDFVGRATRSEFWFVFLFAFIVNWACSYFIGGNLALIVNAILFIPVMSLSIRRFRDAGVSVWLYIIPILLICAAPIIRGSTWFVMVSFGYVPLDMEIYALFIVLDAIFNIIVACLPTKK